MGVSANFAQNAQRLISLATTQISPVPLSGSSVTLTTAQANNPVVELTGALVAPCTVNIPNQGGWVFLNLTTGGQTITLANGAGATLALAPNVPVNVLSLPTQGVLSVGSAGATGVTAFNTRTGAVILQSADVTSAGGALLSSPAFVGVPTAPTATAGDNSTTLATTAFVTTAISGSLATYAPLASPAFTGTPTAPTPVSSSDSTTKIATTAFVQSVLSAISGGLNYVGTWNASTNTPHLTSGVGTKGNLYKVSVAGSTNLDGNSTWNVNDQLVFDGSTWDFIAGQAVQVASFNGRVGAITLTSSDVTTALGFTPVSAAAIAGLAPLASPSFTGVPTAPTAAGGTNTTQIATTAFVSSNFASLASPAFTGVPTAPTASNGTSTTQIATTAFVQNSMGSFAPLASPTFTGTPAAPTPTAGDSSTKIATTAFVAGNYAPKASPTLTGRAQSDAYSYTTAALGNISGTATLNLSSATEWSATIVGATAFAFTNTLGTNTSEVIFLRLTNAGAFTINWPASTQFAAKTAPIFTASGVDLLGIKYDQVTSTYMVFVLGQNIG